MARRWLGRGPWPQTASRRLLIAAVLVIFVVPCLGLFGTRSDAQALTIVTGHAYTFESPAFTLPVQLDSIGDVYGRLPCKFVYRNGRTVRVPAGYATTPAMVITIADMPAADVARLQGWEQQATECGSRAWGEGVELLETGPDHQGVIAQWDLTQAWPFRVRLRTSPGGDTVRTITIRAATITETS